jgi:hypothetical protein
MTRIDGNQVQVHLVAIRLVIENEIFRSEAKVILDLLLNFP